MEELTQNLKYYDYYSEAYTAILGGFVGEYYTEVDCEEIQRVHPKENQSPEYSLERLILTLKLQYFGHLM